MGIQLLHRRRRTEVKQLHPGPMSSCVGPHPTVPGPLSSLKFLGVVGSHPPPKSRAVSDPYSGWQWLTVPPITTQLRRTAAAGPHW